MTWADFAPLTIELILVVGALTMLGIDLLLPRENKNVVSWGTLAILLAALAGTWLLPLEGEALFGAYAGSPMAVLFKRIVLAAGAMAVLGHVTYGQRAYPGRQAEYHQMLLFSTVGMTLLGGVQDLILLVVAFELMGIPLYAMAGWQREGGAAEAALKLYLVGAASSIVTLYGASLLFGVTGSTAIVDVATAMNTAPTTMLALGAALAVAGMGFKIGIVPFHMWVPDTYQGAPTPFVVFLSIGPKAAGLAALVVVLLPGGAALLGGVAELLLVLSAVTIVVGTFMALPQSNIKRLLGFSGVAHMGFLLMALVTGTSEGLATLLFYLVGYLFTNAGAFLVVHAVESAGGDDSISAFDGLGRHSYFLGMAMLLFVLSLAGIPFVVGFWAKIYVFMAAWAAGFEWLVILGALVSVIGLFYYLKVARAMFMNPDPHGRTQPLKVDWPTKLGIIISLVMVCAMGFVPWPFIDAARAAAQAFLG